MTFLVATTGPSWDAVIVAIATVTVAAIAAMTALTRLAVHIIRRQISETVTPVIHELTRSMDAGFEKVATSQGRLSDRVARLEGAQGLRRRWDDPPEQPAPTTP